MGGGSTIAAACAIGYRSIGIEADAEFYRIAEESIPKLATLSTHPEKHTPLARSPQVVTQEDLFTLGQDLAMSSEGRTTSLLL
jgi:DNA modification methylase